MRADFSANLIDAYWLGQVLEAALAEIVENEWRVATNMVEQHSAHPDRAGRGCLLEARGQIDAVSNEIVAMDGHVREMDAETHLQRFDVRPIGARKRYAYLDGAAQGIDRAWKLRQRRIAGPVEYPAVERGDLLRYQGLTGRESRDGLLFRLLHHRGVADDVANHDRRHSTLHDWKPEDHSG